MNKFQLDSDLVAVEDSALKGLRCSTGKRFLTSDKAILLASESQTISAEQAIMLVEHPDLRVPLALLRNNHIKWDVSKTAYDSRPSRIGGPVVLALSYRGEKEAEDGGYLWTPILDAVCDRSADWTYSWSRSVAEMGFAHAGSRSRLSSTARERIKASKDCSLFTNSPWAKRHTTGMSVESARASISQMAKDGLNNNEIVLLLKSFRSTIFLDAVVGRVGEDLVLYVDRGPNVKLTQEEALDLWHWGTHLRAHLMDQAIPAELAMAEMAGSSGRKWGVWSDCVSRLIARGDVGDDAWSQYIGVLISHKAYRAGHVVNKLIKAGIISTGVVDTIIARMKTMQGDSTYLSSLASILSSWDNINATQAENLLDISSDRQVRMNVAQCSAGRGSVALAERILRYKDPALTKTIMSRLSPEVYGIVFSKAAILKPDVAGDTLADRLEEVGDHVKRTDAAGVLSRGSKETRDKVIGTVGRLRG